MDEIFFPWFRLRSAAPGFPWIKIFSRTKIRVVKAIVVEELHKAYIGIGANLGDPMTTARSTLAALASLPGTTLLSSSMFYRSPPLGPVRQPDFINAVAAIRTPLAPLALLSRLQSIERRYGRVRNGVRWGPRTLDLDLLLYEDLLINEDTLTVPHPGLCQRAFVLYPLYEIAPDLEIPGHGPLVRLLEAVAGQRIRIADDSGSSRIPDHVLQ